ncbi:hypothetical protein [Streptomyces sp. NPDC048277]|uniref:hypothetical protein n=1 Tax=Streptomyces sp. NPDC048277 TaxID=3155027 RepID=UPI0033E49590
MGRGEGGLQLSDVFTVFAALGGELLSEAADQVLAAASASGWRALLPRALRRASTCGRRTGWWEMKPLPCRPSATSAVLIGNPGCHLVALQMPVSLVMMTPIVQALDGRGPLLAAVGAGLRVMASAPLHGGELPVMVDQELADLIRRGLPPRYLLRGPARGLLASGPGMAGPPCRTDDLGGGVTGLERRRWRR